MTDRAMASIVGMDLGTSNSAVAIRKNGRVKVLECEGSSAIPSYVSFSKEDVVDVGRSATREAAYKQKNTIYDIKRIIGRQFGDTFIQEQMKNWPFKLTEGKNGEVVVVLEFEDRKIAMNPEEIAAKIILKMRDLASDHFNNRPVTSAVVAIPAYFCVDQCNATCRAAKLAGVDIIELISEPLAAVLAYAEHTSKYTGYTLLVFDLGGGTFDVTIVTLVDDVINHLVVDGDLNLGGRNFDDILFNHCMVKIKETLGRSVGSYHKQKLRYKCEVMKKQLSSQSKISFNTGKLFADVKNVPLVITRNTFEQESQHLVDRCIEITERSLNSAGLKPDDIDHVLLVGGSCKIPIIRRKLVDMFGRDKLYTIDDAVAYGTAVRAAQIHEEMVRANCNSVENVTPSASTSIRSDEFNSVGNGFQNNVIVLEDSPEVYSSEGPASVQHPEASKFNSNRALMSENDNAQAQIMKLTQLNERLTEQLCRSQAKIDQLESDSRFQKSEVLTLRELVIKGKFWVEAAQKKADDLTKLNGHLQDQLTKSKAEQLEIENNKTLNKDLATAKQEIAKFHDRIREANEVNENLVNRLNASRAKCSEFEAKIVDLNDALSKMTEREENAEEISHLQRRFEALQAKNTLLAQEARENERLVSEVYSLRNLLDTAQSEINKVNKANESLTGRLYNLNSKFYKVNARASELEALAESESEENAEKMSQLQRRFEALQAESTELAHRAKETERLETEVYSLTKLLDTAQSEAKQFSDENSLLQVQMTLYEEKFEESNAQKKKAEEEIATLHDRIREVNKLNEDVVERLNTSLLKCSEELATAKEELATECEKYADERSHFQLRLNALEAENTERARCSNETERLRMEVDSLKDLLDTAQNESKQLSDENASLREKMTQYKDALQATDEHYKETLKERECKVTDLEQNLKHFEQLNAQISEELTKSNLNLDQVKKSNECLTEELKAAKDKISEIETQKAQLASQIENERAQNSKENSCLKLRLRTLEAKNIEWAQDNKAIMELTLKNDILTTEFSNAQKQVKELSDGNALLRKQVMQYKDQFNTTDAQRTKLETVYKSLLDMTRKVERDLSVKREQCKHLQKQHAERVAYYRDTLEQRESRIAELDKNVKQSEHIRSCLTEELSKSNWDIQSIRTELERQRYENEQCSLVRDQQRNADQRRIRNLESKLAHAKSLIAGIAEDLNDPESTFQGEQIGPTATNSEYEARKRHSLDNDEEDQDLRDPVKKPYFSPIPPDDLSGLPTPSNSNTTLINHGENDTTLPLLQLPIPAHEDVALNDVGVNGGITAQVDINTIPMPADLNKRKENRNTERKEKRQKKKKKEKRKDKNESERMFW